MPKASKYPSPTGGGLGEEIRELVADLVTRITTRRNESSLNQSVALQAFFTAVNADLTAFNSTVGVVTTASIGGDNVVTAAEKASPVPVVSTLGGTILAGDLLSIRVYNVTTGAIVAQATSAALAAGATTNTTNVDLSTAPIATYRLTVTLTSKGVPEDLFTRTFTVTA